MSIISSVPIGGSRSASANKTSVTFQESWLVTTSSPTITAPFIIANLPLYVGDYIHGYKISSTSLSEGADPVSWVFAITYGKDDEEVDNPLTEPWEWSINFEQYQLTCEFDVHRKPVLNSAKDFFDEPLIIDNSRPVLTGKKTFSSFPWALSNQIVDCVNSDNFQGCASETLKCERLSGSPNRQRVNNQSVIYYDVTVELSFKREKHNREILSKGYRELKNNKLVQIMEGGTAVTQPVLLTQAGLKLPVGGNPHFQKFEVFRKTSFGGAFS